MSQLNDRKPAQAIALAAVAAVALVGALAFVVDAGIFLEARRELQTTADHAAEAGVAFLPDCPYSSSGASCGSGNNTQDTVWQYIQNNGPIARQLCGDASPSNVHAAATFTSTPNTGTTPGWDMASSIYTPPASLDSPNGFDASGDYYYRLDVTVRCSPGFTFGRILLGDANQPLSASASAVVGALNSSACSAPIDVIATAPGYTPNPGTPDNSYGYPPGAGNLNGLSPAPSWINQVRPVLGDPSASPQVWTMNTGLSTYPVNSGDILQLFLPGLPQTGPEWETELCGATCGVCVPLTVNEIVTMNTSPGESIGQVRSGLQSRGYTNAGVCKQSITQVIWTPAETSDPTKLWTVKQGQEFSPCLWTIAVLDYNSIFLQGKTSAPIKAFVSVFIYDLNGNGSNSYWDGLIVKLVGSGQTGGFRQNATKSIRLIR